MKKKLIALLLATATFVSACGAEAEEPEEEDVETIDEEETPKSDEAEDEDGDEGEGDGLFGLGDLATTNQDVTAASEDQAGGDIVADASGGAMAFDYEAEFEKGKSYEEASVTVEQSDVNSNLWIITNTSTTTYSMYGKYYNDRCFAPGEKHYMFRSSSDGEFTKESLWFSESEYDVVEMGSNYDVQTGVVTVEFDPSRYDDSQIENGYGLYDLKDVREAYIPKMVYEDIENMSDDTYTMYFRLLDADGNVIYEPKDFDEFQETQGYFMDLGYAIYLDPSITSWDHAEFYVITRL